MSRLIILAAGEGSRLKPYTQEKPKCLIELHGKSLLDWQIEIARQLEINDIVIVKGYKQEKINHQNIRSYVNSQYFDTNMVETLWCAHEEFQDDIIISYGDIIYDLEVLKAMKQANYQISVAVDKGWLSYWKKRFIDPLTDAESLKVDSSGKILEIGQKVENLTSVHGQFIGLIKFKGKGVELLKNFYQLAKTATARGEKTFRSIRPFKQIFMTDFLQGMIDFGYDVYEVPIMRNWLEVDSLTDYQLAQQITAVEHTRLKFLA